MNPYDFVRIDWTQGPAHKEPQWHHRLTPTDTGTLYSGRLEVQLKAERPLFSPVPGVSGSTLIPFLHRGRDSQKTYIIPGSSLKGMLRSVAETLGNSCLSMFDARYSDKHAQKEVDYSSKIPADFRKCQDHHWLCPACRIFGMMGRGSNAQVFLGKVNISDALSTTAEPHDSIYTLPLTSPKPHHTAFYLDPAQSRIAGRKYYFHQPRRKREDFPTEFKRFSPNGPPVNRHIQPLGEGSRFEFTLDFVNLEADEFALLLLALVLEPKMRHQIGYGKPMGLGSIQLKPTKLMLIDYAKRYALNGGAEFQKTLEGDDKLATYISTHTNPYKSAHLLDTTGAANETLSDLRRIWAWPAREDITYAYPNQGWFYANPFARISQTP